MTIDALESGDTRRFELAVAGPAALLVAKLHKTGERVEHAARRHDKDALGVLRLLRAISIGDLAAGLERLARVELSAEVAREAITYLEELFASADAPG